MASTQTTAPAPTSVYRYYDGIGILIYVGITRQGIGRNLQHNGKAEWWPFVVRQEVDHYPTRAAAAMREKELINSHRPPFNKQHNPSHAEMRAAYLAYASVTSVAMSSLLDFHKHLGGRLPLNIVSHEPGRLILCSRLEHGPLAVTLRQAGQPAVRGRRRQYGHVERIDQIGPIAFIHCFMRSSKKVRPPEGGVGDAEVLTTWDTKAQAASIRQVLVTEGDLVAV